VLDGERVTPLTYKVLERLIGGSNVRVEDARGILPPVCAGRKLAISPAYDAEPPSGFEPLTPSLRGKAHPATAANPSPREYTKGLHVQAVTVNLGGQRCALVVAAMDAYRTRGMHTQTYTEET
jgi:hypothetical protein